MKLDWKSCLRLCGSAFLLFLCVHYWDGFIHFLGTMLKAAVPLFIGCAIAFIANIPMSFYERHYFPNSKKALAIRSRRPVCILLSYASILAVVFLVVRLVAPEVGKCIALLLAAVPPTLEKIAATLSESEWVTEGISQFLQEIDWRNTLINIVNFLKTGIGTVTDWAVNAVAAFFSGVARLFVGLVFSLYLLAGKERLGRQINLLADRYVCPGWRSRGRHLLSLINDCFRRYIVGQCTEAVILGSLCSAGMILFGFPYAAAVGATVGLTALIPVAGAYIGGAVGFLLILTVSPVKAVLFVVYLVVLQQFEGNVIYPRVVGTSLGLPGIWVMVSVILGGGLGGIPGMILSVPMTSCVYRLIKEDIARHRAPGRPEEQ